MGAGRPLELDAVCARAAAARVRSIAPRSLASFRKAHVGTASRRARPAHVISRKRRSGSSRYPITSYANAAPTWPSMMR